ncbi:Hsp70 family protein [Cryptosporangium sp. NPDC051539]|uniref:Hsp70 family protein n=1 Tax=Cryptosporangium sp. NPDC051539 TaxID=3363962 RepID=UPI0037B72094
MTPGVRLGIDFGTAHTVAVLHRPHPEPRLLLFDGSPLLPSAVCAEPDGRLLVGRDALHAGLAAPGAFEPNPKRCVDDRTVLLDENEFAVTDLIGAVLRRVRSEAAATLRAEPDETVLTYPAAWGATRRATLIAAAGGNVRLMPEPVAAAHHFTTVTDDLAVGQAALVYDFGAGTFDASVVRRTSSGFEVLAAEGLPDCGGLDVDAAVVAYFGSVVGGPLWARPRCARRTSRLPRST